MRALARCWLLGLTLLGLVAGISVGAVSAYALNCPPTCTGSNNAETIIGNADANNIDLLGSNDVGLGKGNADDISGGTGNDYIEGDDGWDFKLQGGPGNEYYSGGCDGVPNCGILGEDGNDSLDGGDGIDSLRGGLGDDALNGGGADGNADYCYGGGGNDTFAHCIIG